MITKNGKYQGGTVGHSVSVEARSLIAQSTRRHQVNEEFFSSIDSEIKAYILGFLVTDGHVSDDGVHWSLQARDASILERIKSEMKSTHPIKLVKFTSSNGSVTDGVSFSIYSKRMVNDLRLLGLEYNKTRTVAPWNGPEELLPHYWRGCVDGDGWITKSKVGFTLGFCGNHQMVTGFSSFIQKLTDRENRVRPIKSIFRVEYAGIRPPNDVAKVLRYETASIFLPRKREVVAELSRTVPIRKTYKELTKEKLDNLYCIHKEWTAVAVELGMNYVDLRQVRIRLGMPMSKARNWSTKTKVNNV